MLTEYDCRWSSSIQEINPEDWETIYGKDVIKSYGFLKSNEIADFEGVEFHYLHIYKNEKDIAAIVPCFIYKMDLRNIASSSKAKKIIRNIRKIFPSFLKFKAFVTGSYAATCEHLIEIKEDLPAKEKDEISRLINKEIKNRCEKYKANFIFIKDVRQRDIHKLEDRMGADFKFLISFPTTAIPLIPGIKYPGGLRKKNRKRYRLFKEKFEKSFEWKIVNDYQGEISSQFTELYQAVLDKAKNKFEFLNEKFFTATNNLLNEKSFLLIASNKETKEIRVMVLILENDYNLIPLYMGFKYKNDDSKVIYLNTIFRTIEEAEMRNKEYVDFGQMSYYPKTMSGALTENIYYGFWSYKPLIRYFIKHALKGIFTPPPVPEHVYMKEYAKIAHDVLENRGFKLLN